MPPAKGGGLAEEVCNAVGFPETNRRVLLHRARARVRQPWSHTSE
jgi:hypothetical protein